MDGGRALVLGGGGIAGIAWEAGLVAGLRDAGVDLGEADLIVGTSAGSVVGTFLAHGEDPAEAIDRYTADGARDAAPGQVDVEAMFNAFAILFDESIPPQEARARVGRLALETPENGMGARLAELGRRLPHQDWPDRPFLVTGVDTADGAFTVFSRTSGPPLALAVQASCAVPCVFPPVEIGGRRYMDGGTRSVTNADLAKGAAQVVILEPMAHLTPRGPLERELAELGEARTAVIGPDQAAIDIFGLDVLDNGLWRPAFQAGLAQSAAVADEVKRVWHD